MKARFRTLRLLRKFTEDSIFAIRTKDNIEHKDIIIHMDKLDKHYKKGNNYHRVYQIVTKFHDDVHQLLIKHEGDFKELEFAVNALNISIDLEYYKTANWIVDNCSIGSDFLFQCLLNCDFNAALFCVR